MRLRIKARLRAPARARNLPSPPVAAGTAEESPGESTSVVASPFTPSPASPGAGATVTRRRTKTAAGSARGGRTRWPDDGATHDSPSSATKEEKRGTFTLEERKAALAEAAKTGLAKAKKAPLLSAENRAEVIATGP